jgi:hypothetical protein
MYNIIREKGWNEWEMIEVEKYPCNDGNEARKRERYWYETLHANLNSRLPISTYNEYYELNKEKIKEQNKISCKNYRLKNKDAYRETQRLYRQKNRDMINQKQREKRLEKKMNL